MADNRSDSAGGKKPPARKQDRATGTTGTPGPKKKDRAAEVANAFEWLITAFILAFIFRAFVMEAFRIPTGSMADTLMGAHFRLRCPECGYAYEYGFDPREYGFETDSVPPGPVRTRQETRCPSCGYHTPPGRIIPVANGDRILVLKCLYQFQEPRRWDVIVFKNPTNPMENYIKRLIGLPGEKIEIIDGDVYINDRIARKPPQVQRELWMPVYDNDYRPVNPKLQGAYNGQPWQPPFDLQASAWAIDPGNPTQLVLKSPGDKIEMLTYDTTSPNSSANDFHVAYAYNEVRSYPYLPVCSDLMTRFYVSTASRSGRIGVALSKRGIDYRAWLDLSGEMVIAKVKDGQEVDRRTADAGVLSPGKLMLFKFANVDHQLLLECNNRLLSWDLGREPNAVEGDRKTPPRAAIFGAGDLTLSHVAIFRDIFYTSEGQSGPYAKAVEHKPFTLHADEFFACGDNSPNSLDGRWWGPPNTANRGWEIPRAGVVPRYYLVGKALFVYWPSGFAFPWPARIKEYLDSPGAKNSLANIARVMVSLRWIPDVGRMRFIYGGTQPQETQNLPAPTADKQ